MIIVVLMVLGLCFGSFVNALVWRLHEQGKAKSKVQKAKLSITKGRSMCVHCGHTLGWQDLLPVASWLSLGGKCRYCKKPISWQYPLVELATAALFMISYVYFPFELSQLFAFSSLLLALWLAICVGFMALIVYDIRWMLLPDRIVFPLQGLAGLHVLVLAVTGNDVGVIASSLWGVVFSAGIFYMLFQVSKGKWIGGGDVKLAVILGLLLGGPVNALLMLFLASVMGSIIGLPLMLFGKAKRDTKLPFGPFLITATIIVYLFGVSMITWYERQFLFM